MNHRHYLSLKKKKHHIKSKRCGKVFIDEGAPAVIEDALAWFTAQQTPPLPRQNYRPSERKPSFSFMPLSSSIIDLMQKQAIYPRPPLGEMLMAIANSKRKKKKWFISIYIFVLFKTFLTPFSLSLFSLFAAFSSSWDMLLRPNKILMKAQTHIAIYLKSDQRINPMRYKL